jgi:hypothetical protein
MQYIPASGFPLARQKFGRTLSERCLNCVSLMAIYSLSIFFTLDTTEPTIPE